MNYKIFPLKLFLYILIAIFAFYVNYFYANKGLFPIDSFSFFDSGYNIANGKHPIKDFWIISGILIDYIQAIFFYIFGFNWNAYVFHASTFNASISIFFFYFLNQFNKDIIFNFILCLSLATLCYPIIGTPFPYQHSFILSLASILIFYLAVLKEEKKYWIILPFCMISSFLSMQLPSGLINLIIIIFALFYFIKINISFLKYFFLSSFSILCLLVIFFILTDISFQDFLLQIILFPLTVGEGRIMGYENSFQGATLAKKFTLRGVLGHFKFINIFLLANIIFIYIYIKKNSKIIRIDKKILVNLFVLICGCAFIFHQLITANQTFIFSLIPILCGFFIIQLSYSIKRKSKIINIFLILLISFITVKYHLVYNVERKFVDLQNVDLSNSINAKVLDNKFNNLQWITPNNSSPKDEIELLLQVINTLKKDKDYKMLITHYQFFSIIINENLNIPNRWYFPNNTFPSSNKNKYYKEYIKRFKSILIKENIKKVYIVEGFPGEFSFINFNDLIGKNCFKKEKYNKIFYSINIMKRCD